MANDPPPILTLLQELLAWTLDRSASIPKAHRFTFGQRLDGLTMAALERAVEARFTAGPSRLRALDSLNLALEKLRVFWRIVASRGWISTGQLLHAIRSIDEIGRMAGAWRKASAARGGRGHP